MNTAKGRTFVPLDADDLIVDREALQLQLSWIDAEPELAAVFSAVCEVDDAGRLIGVRRPLGTAAVLSSEGAFKRLLERNEIVHSGAMIRRECYAAVRRL